MRHGKRVPDCVAEQGAHHAGHRECRRKCNLKQKLAVHFVSKAKCTDGSTAYTTVYDEMHNRDYWFTAGGTGCAYQGASVIATAAQRAAASRTRQRAALRPLVRDCAFVPQTQGSYGVAGACLASKHCLLQPGSSWQLRDYA